MVTKYAKLFTALVIMLALLVCVPVMGMAESMDYAIRYEFNLGETLEFDFAPERFYVDIKDYLYEKFICDWDGDGTIEADELNDHISIEWSGMEFTGGVDTQFGNHGASAPERLVATVSSPSEDCEATLLLTNKDNGDTFVMTYQGDCSYLYSYPLQVSVNGQSVDYTEGYAIEVDAGATVTLTARDEYTGNREHTYTYSWTSYDRNSGTTTELPATGNTYTFTMNSDEYTVDCTTMVHFEDGPAKAGSEHSIRLRKTQPDVMLHVETSHPVVDDVMTVTEGDTVSIATNPTCTDPTVELINNWYFETWDENGRFVASEELDETGPTLTFAANAEMNGLHIYCEVYSKEVRVDMGWLDYTLKVLPKEEEPIEPAEVTFNVVSSHPVVADVLTVTEGETVTIATNPTCTDPTVELINHWFFHTYDENGECIEEDYLDETAPTLTFVATADMNGKHVYTEAFGKDIHTYTAILDYTLKVLPKVVEPEEQYKQVIEEGITDETLSEELKADPNLDTPEKVEADITIKVLAEAKSSGMETSSEQIAVYDVELMYSEDGGETFVEATKENWPASGKITVTLPYPEGTGKDTHTFVVAHMFTQTTADHKAGDIEYPVVTNTANGIQFEVTGLSPIAIAWEANPETPDVPTTGDSATPYLWLIGMLAAGLGCTLLVSKRRQNT